MNRIGVNGLLWLPPVIIVKYPIIRMSVINIIIKVVECLIPIGRSLMLKSGFQIAMNSVVNIKKVMDTKAQIRITQGS